MNRCSYTKHILKFYKPAGTSRGILYQKESFFLKWEKEEGIYYAECGLLRGLSIDDKPDYEEQLKKVCLAIENDQINHLHLPLYPSIQCGIDMLLLAYSNRKSDKYFNNDFYNRSTSIPINGLIWMGDESFMKQQIDEKISKKFRCIKMKVGAIDWQNEKALLEYMRNKGGKDLVIRVDANGAWKNNDETKRKLEILGKMNVHSIEQVTEVGNYEDHINLHRESPIAFALDEELFLHTEKKSRAKLLDTLKVEYIVLKPCLVGGFKACDEWISLCEERNIDYWITSALESNVCLNAISQYTFPHKKENFQGLGTGSLYDNNIPSPLQIIGDEMMYNNELPWDYSILDF